MSLNFTIKTFDELDSTNLKVKQAIAEGVPEGLVIVARRQTAGYGRRGHAWKSPQGGLYCSLLLRPEVSDNKLSTLPLVIGATLRQACQELAPEAPLRLKWPNDVVLEGGHASEFSNEFYTKIAGITCEKVQEGVCVGVGVDVPLLGSTATPQALMESFLRLFVATYETWLTSGLTPFLEELNAIHILQDKRVAIEVAQGRGTLAGVVHAVDEEGRLLVFDDRGVLNRVSSGEAHIVLQ